MEKRPIESEKRRKEEIGTTKRRELYSHKDRTKENGIGQIFLHSEITHLHEMDERVNQKTSPEEFDQVVFGFRSLLGEYEPKEAKEKQGNTNDEQSKQHGERDDGEIPILRTATRMHRELNGVYYVTGVSKEVEHAKENERPEKPGLEHSIVLGPSETKKPLGTEVERNGEKA